MLNPREGMLEILRAAYPEVVLNDEVAYFGEVASLYSALACSALFWPRLIEIDGAVFVALHGDDEFELANRFRSLVNKEGIHPHTSIWREWISTFNKFEIVHLFNHWSGPQNIMGPAAEALGKVLVQTWSARLRECYPTRTFEVELILDDGEESTRIVVRQLSE
ncbi:hypothetical protein ABZ470_21430 [Streptosporangium sp. NPDC020072]|uniref:hypothetical protein n=1 Tax=Streptosporangium sp. NPDC020072 TaxID=3154788 RepID=UPI00342086E9